MQIHKEGRVTLLIVAVFILAVNYGALKLFSGQYFVLVPLLIASLMLYLLVMWFFRVPNRQSIDDPKAIIAPCDGKVVVIENTIESEFLNEETLQISIFMSPLDVHMNWYPASGLIKYAKLHKGSHIVAWAPKASTDNERSTVAIETDQHKRIVVRQIAGAMARRVVCYARKDNYADQNGHLGFIKFGSRVDLFLPKSDIELKVELNQKVTGTQTIIARFK